MFRSLALIAAATLGLSAAALARTSRPACTNCHCRLWPGARDRPNRPWATHQPCAVRCTGTSARRARPASSGGMAATRSKVVPELNRGGASTSRRGPSQGGRITASACCATGCG